MKKIYFIVVLFFSLQNYAQKTFEVYNFTGQTVTLYDIITNTSSGGYPEYHSKPFGGVPIPPGESYTLENTANIFRFPFHSPASVPYIDIWERLDSATSSTTTIVSSNVAWVLGNNQVFKSLIFSVGSSWNNLTPTGPNATIIGSGWTLDYSHTVPATNTAFYTIVIY